MTTQLHFKLVLASQSPRRKDLLNQAGYRFTILPVNLSEIPDKNLNLDQQILKIAREKAEACLGQHNYLKSNDFLILSADTMVIVDGQPYGKPDSKNQASEYLRLLSGRSHEVKTALFLINCLTFEQESSLTTTKVHFRTLSENEIQDYVDSGEPMDKAGAYGIQGLGKTFISRVEGPFDNVVGLSIESFQHLLEKRGWTLE